MPQLKGFQAGYIQQGIFQLEGIDLGHPVGVRFFDLFWCFSKTSKI